MGGIVNRLLFLGRGGKEKLTDKLRKAKRANDPTEYTKTRFVRIGNSYVNFSTYQDSSTGTSFTLQGKDYPDGTAHDSGIINGVGYFEPNILGLSYCLHEEINPADAPTDFWISNASPGLIPQFNTERPAWDQFWSYTASKWGIQVYKIEFTCNVPKFNKSDVQGYYDLVLAYWESGLESDLDAIDSYLMSYALNYSDL